VVQDSSVPLSVHHAMARGDAELLRPARAGDPRVPPAPHVLLLSVRVSDLRVPPAPHVLLLSSLAA